MSLATTEKIIEGERMIDRFKALGLVLFAVLVLGGVAATAASASHGKLVSDGPVTLIAAQTGLPSANSIEAFGGDTTCANAIFTGHKWSVTPHTFIPSSSDLLTITPHYGSCSSVIAAGSFPTTVDMNGCDFEFWLGETTGTDQYAVLTTIVCPLNKHMTITVFASAAKHTANEPFCHTTITENAGGYVGLRMTDTTNGLADISGTMTGIFADKKVRPAAFSARNRRPPMHQFQSIGRSKAGTNSDPKQTLRSLMNKPVDRPTKGKK
jgi:hypothetical protein